MVQAGVGGLDTPRTNLGDATYLSTQQLEFDISQEQSFQSPSKDNNNLLQQLQNGRRGAINLKTPRSRAALGDRRNLPAGLGGGEFTPLLKSATRNSALRNGKENVPATPAFLKPGGLDNITEDLSPLPHGSSFGESRNGSYMAGTPMPHIDSSSAASTPMALLPRRNEGPGVLQDGNQLSLREQENVIDKIEKENFGLKLKIHFLEEALRKAGPGFSEAALKENTELKVDKVTMQKELLRFRKTLASAEKDVDVYRQQFIEMQEKVKRKMMDQDQRQELDRLRETLEERDAEVNRLKSQGIQFEDLQDTIDDLKADLREKDRLLDNRDDELENLRDDLEKRDNTISELQNSLKDAQRQAIELEEKAQVSEELEEAKETIEELEQALKRAKTEGQDAKEELEQDLRRLEEEVEDAKEEKDEAVKEKQRAEADLEELQEEIANKSMTTKGRSRQIEEKANRLQDELEGLREKYETLEDDHAEKAREVKNLKDKLEDLNQDSEVKEQKLMERIEVLENESKSSAHECEALLHKIETIKSENFSSAREREVLSKRLEATQTEHQSSAKERETFLKQIETIRNEFNQKSDEKNLLQIRHDALTAESASLQRDLARSEKTIEDLEDKLDHEKTLALDSERQLRDQYKNEIDRLNDQIENLQAQLEESKREYDGHYELFASERKTQLSQTEMAEEKAASLQRTIDRLQEAEGSLSTKESKLKQALESEKERHASAESILNRQIQEHKQDLDDKLNAIENNKDTMLMLREELRASQREQKLLAEKVEGLEDEVEILQTSLDDESEQANNEIAAAKKDSEALRQQIRSLKDDLSKAEFATARTRAEIESFQGDLQAGEGSKQQLNSRLREVESHLAGVRQDKLSLQDQLANLQTELQYLRTSNADVVAERDELQSQLRSVQQQGEETFRIDQERVDLRTAKMKLDGEIRRLKEENKVAVAQQEAIEKDLQQEIDRAGAEEARLNTEISDLQRILRGSSEKKELAAAKKNIQKLEARIQELETQAASADGQIDVAHELSIIRNDLSSARQKETEFLQREAAQKDAVRTLKRQITDLERKAHEAEVSRFASSPHSSIGGSARKSEIIELRAQLATAHQTLKEVRSQLKEAEKDASKKMTALNIDIQAQQTAWDAEKDELEHALDEAELARGELEAKNATSEATVTRLRSKIDRLEKALTHERQNTGEDRSIVAERRDLHEMLRETQLQAESLEIVVQERDHKIAAITSAEQELRSQLKRVRDERALHRSEAVSLHEQLENMERKYKRAKDKWITEKKTWETQIKAWEDEMTHHDAEKAHWDAEKKHWDAEERHWSLERQTWQNEKKTLTRGVRFANMSLSINEDAEQLAALKLAMEEREKMHVKEMRGRAMQLEWLRAKCQREENFRDDAAYAKRYMGMQIDMYRACNEADIRMLEAAGIQRPPRRPKKRPTLRLVATAIIATVRMQMGAAKWAESRKISDRIEAKIEQQRIQALQKEQKEQQMHMQTVKKCAGRR